MEIIELKNLKERLQQDTNQIYCVHITQETCPDCIAQCENIESILVPMFPQIVWLKLYVTPEEGTPLFSPQIVPSNVFFKGSERVTEVMGLIQDFNSVGEFIENMIDYTQLEIDSRQAQPTTQ